MEDDALLDTNILIDMVNGIQQARVALLPYRAFSISRIAWIELMTGLQPGQVSTVQQLMRSVSIIDVSEAIAARTVQLRQTTKLKLADAIIYATALEHGLTLLTRNTRDFRPEMLQIHVPYRL